MLHNLHLSRDTSMAFCTSALLHPLNQLYWDQTKNSCGLGCICRIRGTSLGGLLLWLGFMVKYGHQNNLWEDIYSMGSVHMQSSCPSQNYPNIMPPRVFALQTTNRRRRRRENQALSDVRTICEVSSDAYQSVCACSEILCVRVCSCFACTVVRGIITAITLLWQLFGTN